MIDIIEHGRLTADNYRKYKVTCGKCGCVFTCEGFDLGWDNYSDDRIIRCPECDEKVYVREDDEI